MVLSVTSEEISLKQEKKMMPIIRTYPRGKSDPCRTGSSGPSIMASG